MEEEQKQENLKVTCDNMRTEIIVYVVQYFVLSRPITHSQKKIKIDEIFEIRNLKKYESLLFCL